MAFGGGNSNSAFLAVLIVAAALVSQTAGISLKARDHRCGKAEEGKTVTVLIQKQTGLSVDCRCEKGIVTDCERPKSRRSCTEELKGCHYVEPGGPHSPCDQVCKTCSDPESGARQPSGSSWGNCTASHTCFSGVVTTSTVECPTPMCADPVTLPGQCCPSCPTKQGKAQCRRGLQPFAEGETKDDITDPCNECTCDKGHLTCVRRVCPVLPCEKRLQKVPKGKCCPECVRLHGSNPVMKSMSTHLCLFGKKVYRRGRPTSPVDTCTDCRCDTKTLQVICERTNCPVLGCPKERQARQKEGDCCKVCTGGDATSASTAVAVAPAAAAASRPSHCVHRGEVHEDGSVWEDKSACASCSCESGETKCRPTECAPGVCTVFGDPHYKTFDGRIFNFQGSCKYLLARDCGVDHGVHNSNSTSSFSIRITNDARDSFGFSWLRTITMRYRKAGEGQEGEVKVSLMQNMKVKVNGKRVSLPYIKLSSGLSIMKDGYRVFLRTSEGVNILWDGVSFLELKVPPKFRNRMCGLCGNYDGDKANDFYGRDGTGLVHGDGQAFGDDWRVGGLRACSVLPRDMPTVSERHCTQTWEAKIKSDRNCNALNSTLFHSCLKHVKPAYYYDACKLDMCECPGDMCHCEVLTAYARECENAGVVVHRWREETGCMNVTPFTFAGKGQSREADLTGNEVAVADAPWSTPEHKPKWPGQILSAATLNDQQKIEPGVGVEHHGGDDRKGAAGGFERGLGRVEAACTAANARYCGKGKPEQISPETEVERRRERQQRRRRRKHEKKSKKKRQRLQERRRRRKEMQQLKRRFMGMGRNRGRKKHKRQKGGSESARRPHAKPPFETLLNPGGPAADQPEVEEEEGEEDSSTLVIPQNRDFKRVDVEARTPLPLFEGTNQRRTKRT